MASTLMRKFAATIAAYAIALQAVLAAFAIAAPLASVEARAPAGIVICRGDDAGAPAVPRTHDPCDACLAGHCAGAAAVPEGAAIAAFWPVAVAGAEISLHAATRATATRHDAHSPRAPPRV